MWRTTTDKMKASILIVDDERDTRELMARALGEDYRVTTASDAEQAVKALENDPSIALMLSDVRMPGADGIQLLKTAKKMRPQLACILLTAFGSVDLAVEAMKDGADDFLEPLHRGFKAFGLFHVLPPSRCSQWPSRCRRTGAG